MGSKRQLGQARREWRAAVAPAERAAQTIEGFTAGMLLSSQMRSSPAAQATARVVDLWRSNHRITYTVDADLQAEVRRGGLPKGGIPGDVFRRLPHPAPLFILAEPVPVPDRVNGTTLQYEMFAVAAVKDRLLNSATGEPLPDPQPLLRFAWFASDPAVDDQFVFTTSSMRLTSTIDLHATLDTILADVPAAAGELAVLSKQIRGDNWEDVTSALFPLAVGLVMYACSQDPDLQPLRPPAALQKGRPATTEGARDLYRLGFRVGSAIRGARRAATASGNGEGRTVTPHMRKAHWHRFWTGPRNEPERRELVLRWIPPVAVNAESGAPQPTVHPLRQRKGVK